jgi:LuxR family quorum-sensing system transcriptional regulator CciR
LERYHDEQGLGVRDPVHRLSQLRTAGFPWSALPSLLPDYGPADERVLAHARRAGVVDGYTVPFHAPGERSGSCSFAVGPGQTFPRHLIPLLESLGSFASQAARLLREPGPRFRLKTAKLTPRQHEIVVLLGHGMPLKQIARVLDISPDTVNDHLRIARANFGVHKSTLLLVCGLVSGSITYSELLAH